MWKKISLFIIGILFLCCYSFAEEDIVNKVLQPFSAQVIDLGDNHIQLSGNTYLYKTVEREKVEIENTFQVYYEDENGYAKLAYRNADENIYYDLETDKEVNIIFSEDMESSTDELGFLAISSEMPLTVDGNKSYFINYDVDIIFPTEVIYEGKKVDNIKIEGQKLAVESHSQNELFTTWSTSEVIVPDNVIAMYEEETQKYYIPITVIANTESIICKCYVPKPSDDPNAVVSSAETGKVNEGVDYSYLLNSGNSFDAALEKYDEKREYLVGDSLGILVTRACMHDIYNTTYKESTTTIEGEWHYAGNYMHGETMDYNINYSVPEGAANVKVVENEANSYMCDNGREQKAMDVYYQDPPTTVTTHTPVTVKVGERSCPVTVIFEGFRAKGYGKSNEVSPRKGGKGKYLTKSDLLWQGDIVIDSSSFSPDILKERKYDSERGQYYGKIIIECDGKRKEFKIYFRTLPNLNYGITYKSDPTEAGKVPVNKSYSASDVQKGIIERYEAEASYKYRFLYWVFEYYNKETGALVEKKTVSDISGEFKMPEKDIVATAYFEKKVTPPKEITVYIIGKGDVTLNGKTIENGYQTIVKEGEKLNFEAKDFKETVTEVYYLLGFLPIPRPVEINWEFVKYGSNIKETIFTDSIYTHTVGEESEIYVYFKENRNPEQYYAVRYAVTPQGTAELPEDKMYSRSDIDNKTSNFEEPELWLKLNDGYEFDYWEFLNDEGKTISSTYDKTTGRGSFKMPLANVTAVAHCKEKMDDSKGYTLYVTSTEGGTAWTDGNENYPNVLPVTEGLPEGKIMYKITDVKPGEKFKIKYKQEDSGYEFGFWEYKPFIKPDSESGNTIEITMPSSDLTVTAIFKNNEVKEEPTLTVTTNNPEWGNSYVIIDGVPIVADKYKDVTVGEDYAVRYDSKPGCYFVNWNYSTTETPFVDDNVIKMPNKDLEVMAMFAPIPLQGPGGHSITFKAEPPEGGKVPDDKDLINILPGGKVTIAVTPNKGWEFDYWRFENSAGESVYPPVEYDPITGTGYFIMPDYDVVAIAVFKESEKDYYKLYISYYYGGKAWTINNGERTEYVEKAYVGDSYPLRYEILNSNYEFSHWEFRWNKYGDELNSEDIKPDEFVKQGYAVMPRSDMTVTAVFKEINPTKEPSIMVSTNNELWGDAWIKVNGVEYHSEWVSVEAGKEYEVYYKPKAGKFTNWSTEKYFKEYKEGVFRAILKMPDEKVELMAFFKPGDENENEFTLMVSADPEEGGAVKIKNGGTVLTNIVSGTQCRVVATSNEGYKFRYWYIIKDGKKVSVSDEEIYDFRMPSENRELIAYFKYVGAGEPDKYELTVSVDPIIAGTPKIEGYGSQISIEVEPGTACKVTVVESGKIIESNGYKYKYVFDGWYENNKKVWADQTYEFIMNKDRYLVAVFNEQLIEDTIAKINNDTFRIVSVRDLNWKNYFTTSSGGLTGKYFAVPNGKTTMLQNVYVNSKEEYSNTVKMGYAVEFELDTMSIPYEYAYLKITPQLVDSKGTIVSNEEVFDGNKKISGSSLSYFLSPITIYANKSDIRSNNAYSKFMADAVSKELYSNGINQHFITWKWVYYLPAETNIPGLKDKVTVRFKIELYEKQSNEKQLDLVKYYNFNKNKWAGDMYNYSLTKSLLDDIYDNAQN